MVADNRALSALLLLAPAVLFFTVVFVVPVGLMVRYSFYQQTTTGDLTSAFNFVAPNRSVPSLPATSLDDSRVVGPGANCPTEPSTLAGFSVPPYPVPRNGKPKQERGRARRPSGPRPAHERARGRRRRHRRR